MGKSLADFVKDNQKFLKLADGDSVDAFYLGQRVIASKFDSSKESVEYALKVDGRILVWTCGNIGVAQAMMQLKKGDPVTIKRDGEGTKTKYEITSPVLKSEEGVVQGRIANAPEAADTATEDNPFGDEVPF